MAMGEWRRGGRREEENGGKGEDGEGRREGRRGGGRGKGEEKEYGRGQ